MKNILNARFVFGTVLIILAILSRFIPHPFNFSPIMAVALFAGVNFSNKRMAFAIPLVAMLISDIFLGFHSTMIAVYLSYAIVVFIGLKLKSNINMLKIAGGTLAGSLLFFIITNFAVWMLTNMYIKDFSGLVNCYVMAIPFFKNSLLGDLIYTTVLFGSFALAERTLPVLLIKNEVQ